MIKSTGKNADPRPAPAGGMVGPAGLSWARAWDMAGAIVDAQAGLGRYLTAREQESIAAGIYVYQNTGFDNG